jgi:3-methylfumaryl-CoA hydratase
VDAPPEPGDALPPLWHWLYFLPVDRQSELGPDGHPHRGGFLPPVELPRRMWAGSRLEFHRPLRVGEAVTRTSRIQGVRLKEGKTGPLVFVEVRHEICGPQGAALTENHDIVYRERCRPSEATTKPLSAPELCAWQRTIHPDDVMLFRYSALTFNGHRIHYDRRYAREVEGYPGLVVHGPLIATLLTDLLRRSLARTQVARIAFRATCPLFDTAPFVVCGQPNEDQKTVRLCAKNQEGQLAMDATATLI